VFSVTVTGHRRAPRPARSASRTAPPSCTLTLANGAGTCTLGATQLTVGSYASLTAVYSGDANFDRHLEHGEPDRRPGRYRRPR